MITAHSINETLAWDFSPEQKLAFLEFTEDNIEELYEALTITKADYEYLMEHVVKKAKALLKEHPEIFNK